MTRVLIPSATAIGAALALAACGSSSGGGGTNSTASATNAAASGSTRAPATVRKVAGVGQVLVASNGDVLYTNNQDHAGSIACASGCTAFWKPVHAAGRPTTVHGVKLSAVKRPGGTQLAANGKPVYTFVEDSPGTAKGNGFKDQFGGHHFTWRAVVLGAAKSASQGPVSSSSSTTNYPGY